MTIPLTNTTPPTPASSTPPAWVRAVDLFCLLLTILASIVALSGGFRVRLAGYRFALTSPYRLLFWVVVIAGVRHFAARDTPIYRDLPKRLAGWWRLSGVHSAVSVVVGTRLVILFVGYLAVLMIGYANGTAPFRLSDNELINLPVRWDAGWYYGIAQEGYSFEPHRTDRQQNIVFFPAYPVLVRGVGRLLGGTVPAVLLASVLVSLGAFLGALIYLYSLARDGLNDEQARYAQWLIAAYPFAYFFGAFYTESLFLLAALGAFCHFTRGQFWRAAFWGLLVGLTRHVGCLVSVPLALLAIGPWLPHRIIGGPVSRLPRSSIVKALAAAAMPGVGMMIYSAYVWQLTGDPLAWVVGHAAWGRQYNGLSALVVGHYEYIANAGFAGYVAQLPHDLLNALGVVFVLAATWPVARRLGIAYAVFILINMLPPLADGGLVSAGRVSSVLFPAFIWFASAVPERHRGGWLVTFGALQAFIAALFYTWRPMY